MKMVVALGAHLPFLWLGNVYTLLYTPTHLPENAQLWLQLTILGVPDPVPCVQAQP